MSRLDQIVKGSPPPPRAGFPYVSHTPSPPLFDTPLDDPESLETSATATPDPLSILPSSPPQIYLNLLIVETALRSQYLALRDRRRQNTFFLFLLSLWIAYFSYALFLRPREDGSGVGGSVYWMVETTEKVALLGGVVTGILIWGTGQWERGVRWPRRWLGIANRGLRTMNAKIVVIRGPWWKEILSYLSFVFPYSAFFPSNTAYHYVEYETTAANHHGPSRKRSGSIRRHSHHDAERALGVEEDLAPGGDYIKLLLLPKSFSPAFRETWDEYRTEFWDKENERRSILRQKVREYARQQAKAEDGWFWWIGWRWKTNRVPTISITNTKNANNKTERLHKHSQSRHLGDKDLAMKPRRTPSPLTESHGHSRASSRSTTPGQFSDMDEKRTPSDRERTGTRTRRDSGASGHERPRKSKSLSISSGKGRLPSSPLMHMEGQQDNDEPQR
ncbi:hypothetical protein FQN57_007433 [Myotisia sp. PD_48]|nr:hypothetical protein FQN57_007433 [Myotisia sp. PD_48]